MFLWIDSTAADAVRIGLSVQRPCKTFHVAWRTLYTRDVLAALTHVLHGHRKKIKDIVGIAVFQGPGMFSRVRAGVVTANTLAFSLDVPLWGVKDGRCTFMRKPLLPHYGKPPTITRPKL